MRFMPLALLILLPAVSDAKDPIAQKLTNNRDFLQHLTWSPDGNQFLFTRIHKGRMALWTMQADGKRWKMLIPGHTQPTFDGSWSLDSKKIAFVFDKFQGTDGKLQINVCNRNGDEHYNVIPQKAFEESPRWSPDGNRLLWVTTRDSNQEIYQVDAQGKSLKRITNNPAIDNNPCWSPDGKQIAFCSSRKGNLDIFVMQADGSKVRQLTTHARMDYWPVWSPDGKHIAFTSNRDGNYEIYMMRADGSHQRNLTHSAAKDNYPTWSPDGKRLAFLSNRGGGMNVFVQSISDIKDPKSRK